MPITPEELRRLSDDVARPRAITGYLYCATCAYCLRTLPMVGRCPECGNPYDARVSNMTGIFVAVDQRVPLAPALFAVMNLAIAVYSLVAWIDSGEAWPLGAAVFFGVLGMAYLHQTCRRFAEYFAFRSTVRQIEQARQDEPEDWRD